MKCILLKASHPLFSGPLVYYKPGNKKKFKGKQTEKYIFLLVMLLSCCTITFSQPTTVCAATVNGQICSSSNLGDLTPCSKANFIVNYTVPSGYVFASKYEWYANGVLVRTVNASTSNDNVMNDYIINHGTTDIYCDVTFRKSDGVTVSAPQRSQTFRVWAKALNFNAMTGPTSINVGDQNTVSYSIPPGSCGSCFTPTSYNVTWQTPNNWIQTSSSNNGLNASFTPDASSGGPVTGTINLTYSGCSFKESKTLNVTRVMPAVPITGVNAFCGSGSATYTAGAFPDCGGNVTYNWATSSNLNISGGGNTITVTPNGGSTGTAWIEVTASSSCGTSSPYRKWINIEIIPEITGGYYTNPAPGFGTLSPTTNVMCGLNVYSEVHFDLQGTSNLHNVTITNPVGANAFGGAGTYLWFDGFIAEGDYITFRVTVANSCGSNTYDYPFYQYNCPEELAAASQVSLYPNPARDVVSINLKELNKAGAKTQFREIKEITILDKFGNIKKVQKYSSGLKSTTINIGNLPADIYIIMVSDGVNKTSIRLNKIK